jgi:hypothetical protein
MKNITLILAIMLGGILNTFAQTASPNNQASSNSGDYNQAEFYLGYSFAKAKVKEYDRDSRLLLNPALGQTFKKRETFEKGFTVAGVYNLSRAIGIKGDISLNFNGRKGTLSSQNYEVNELLGTYTMGVQLKDNSKDTGNRFRPFANVLAGVANSKSILKNCAPFGTVCPDSLNRSRKGFIGIAGGGIDIKLTQRVTYRLVQVDYLASKITKGWRFSSGVVF